jgi:hypothetical protein
MVRDTSKIWPNSICRVTRRTCDLFAEPHRRFFSDANLPPTQGKAHRGTDDWATL